MNIESSVAEHLPRLEEYARDSRVLVEIGAFQGAGSTLAFRCGFEVNKDPLAWVTVDWKDQIEFWHRPRFPFWTFLLGDSRLAATEQKAKEFTGGCTADVIFIDTEHTYEQMKVELLVWRPMAASCCTWLFHDTWMHGVYNHMTDAIKEFALADGGWEYQDLSKSCHGLGTLIPKERK